MFENNVLFIDFNLIVYIFDSVCFHSTVAFRFLSFPELLAELK